VVLDRRACNASAPSVQELCRSTLCPYFTASSAITGFCSVQCATYCTALGGASRGDALAAGPLYVSVWNSGESGPATTNYTYALSTSCSAAMPCPAPLPGAGACAGHGACVASSSVVAGAAPTCACLSAGAPAGYVWGDVGCDKPLRTLAPGDAPLTSEAVQYGQWSYYSIAAVAGSPLQVTLHRTAGDPLLIVKPAAAGQVPFSVPTLEDYYSYADTASFLAASDDAYRLVLNVSDANAGAGGYVAAVYANNLATVDAAFSISVTADAAAACPLRCSGHGSCLRVNASDPASVPACVCGSGYAGSACEGRFFDFGTESGIAGPLVLPPGGWLFAAFTMPDITRGSFWSLSRTVASTVLVRLSHTGAHPLLLARAGAPPTLTTFDWPVAPAGGSALRIADADVTEADAAWTLVLSPGEKWYFAMYLYAGRSHIDANCTLSFRVGVDITPPSYMAVILGVVLAAFLCMFLFLFKRYGVHWLVRQNEAAWAAEVAAAQAARPRPAPARGLEQALIDQFPTCAFAEGDIREEDANCSVCLSDYEPGEILRKLPVCSHLFHQSCIDEWLVAHQTCPLCRVSLLPSPAPAAAAGEDGQVPVGVAGMPSGGEGFAYGGGTREVELLPPSRSRAPPRPPPLLLGTPAAAPAGAAGAGAAPPPRRAAPAPPAGAGAVAPLPSPLASPALPSPSGAAPAPWPVPAREAPAAAVVDMRAFSADDADSPPQPPRRARTRRIDVDAGAQQGSSAPRASGGGEGGSGGFDAALPPV
jgi:hypothetical protein